MVSGKAKEFCQELFPVVVRPNFDTDATVRKYYSSNGPGFSSCSYVPVLAVISYDHWQLCGIFYPRQDHVLLRAVPAALMDHTHGSYLEVNVVTVTEFATHIETVVRILCRPANLVSAKPGCCQVAVDNTSFK